MTFVELVVAALAVYRLTLLVMYDAIAAGPVEWVVDHLNARKHPDLPSVVGMQAVREARALRPHWVVKLIDCPWCLSFWLAIPVVATGWVWGDRWYWFVPAAVLGASALTGLLTDIAHPEPRPVKDPAEVDEAA